MIIKTTIETRVIGYSGADADEDCGEAGAEIEGERHGGGGGEGVIDPCG